MATTYSSMAQVVGQDILYKGYVVARIEDGVPATIMGEFLEVLNMGGETPPFNGNRERAK